MLSDDRSRLSGAEVVAAAATAVLATAIVIAYLEDWLIRTISPLPILLWSLASGGASFAWLRRGAVWRWGELVALAAIAGGLFVVGLWLAWPDLLPVGRGPDLTHHLLLIDYIDRHWSFVHGPEPEPFLGEMIHYTPGSHVLASLAGAWAASDGLHALHAVAALTVALKGAFVFLVSLRVLPAAGARVPVAAAAVLLLFLPRAYFLGSFTGDSYFSQVISELFAVSIWWALTVWDQHPRFDVIVFLAVAAAAAFLTWPVFVGPPLLAFGILLAAREHLAPATRVRYLVAGICPAIVVAMMHSMGRWGWFLIVRTTAAVMSPSIAVVGWTFLASSAAGLVVAARERRARATTLLLFAIGAQALVLFVLAKSAGAETPYMARKMAYLAIYPLAAAASIALLDAWRFGVGRLGSGGAGDRAAWGALAIGCTVVIWSLATTARPRPALSQSTYLAGRWAREHVAPGCVDYLVGDGDTSYWLHLAVLGNPRMSARTGDERTFDRQQALVRWVLPSGLPFAVADDLSALPRDITDHVEVLARFGSAAVLKRLGDPVCTDPRQPGS